ncbi:MAG: EamA family transporter [Candidatus Aenigmarchaeota archaeon]|nr:EamA family transporter [Candidatus Aenigmarchaeota archaeon]
MTFLLWGTQHPPIKILSGEISPVLFNFLRYFFAGLALVPFVLNERVKIKKEDLLGLSFLGFMGIFIFGIINLVGVRLSTATNNAILLNSWPLLVVFIAPILIREKVTKKAVFGTFIGLLGVVAVVTNGASMGDVVKTEYFMGNLLILLSGVCLAFYSMLGKKYVKKYGGLNVTFAAILVGTMMLFVLSLLSGDIFSLGKISLSSFLLLLWIAVPTTALTYVVWFKSIDRIGLVKTSSFFFIIPISGVVSSSVFLGELITKYTLIGIALILLGVYVVQKKSR